MVRAEDMRQHSIQANKDKISPDVIGAIQEAASSGLFEAHLSPVDHFGVNPPHYARYRQELELEPYKRMLEIAGFKVVYYESHRDPGFIENIIVKW